MSPCPKVGTRGDSIGHDLVALRERATGHLLRAGIRPSIVRRRIAAGEYTWKDFGLIVGGIQQGKIVGALDLGEMGKIAIETGIELKEVFVVKPAIEPQQLTWVPAPMEPQPINRKE